MAIMEIINVALKSCSRWDEIKLYENASQPKKIYIFDDLLKSHIHDN